MAQNKKELEMIHYEKIIQKQSDIVYYILFIDF